MLSFGGVTFEVPGSSYDRVVRRAAWRWPSQDRIARRPAYQFTGPGPETIDLEGAIFPSYAGGALPAALRTIGATGTPHQLVSARETFGPFVLTGVEETWSRFYADGGPRRIEWRLSLTRYGDDLPSGRLTALESAAAAVGDVPAVLAAATAAVAAGRTPAEVLAAATAAAGR